MKKTNIFLLAGIWILCLTGCSSQIEQDITGAEPPAQSAEAEETALPQLAVDFVSNRIPIVDCKNQYENEIREVKKSKYDNISFGDCEMAPINNDVEKVGIYQLYSDDFSVEESVETIKSWLKEIGCEDIDLEKELRDASGQYERDDNLEYPYCYPGVYEHDLDFESGEGFFLNTAQCYVQMGNGMNSMSDGSIAHCLKSGEKPSSDAYGGNQENIVVQGTLSEKKDDVWELPGGKMSVGDAAKVVKDYFEAGTPRKPFEGISVDISDAEVYALDDKYGYAFRVHRVYQGVPFACEFSKEYSDNGNSGAGSSWISEDSKVAYIINSGTVAAFTGYSESEQLRGLVEEQTEIMGFKDAVSLLNNFFAAKVKLEVHKVELVYCPFRDAKENQTVYPCWQFKGINTTNDRGLVAYVNVLSGDVYYYSYWGEEEQPF